MKLIRTNMLAGLALCFGLGVSPAAAQTGDRGFEVELGYEFTYQGQLNEGGAPANGIYDMRFSVYSGSGALLNAPVSYFGIPVVDGLFTVDITLDNALWEEHAKLLKRLQIEVRPTFEGSFIPLSPRVELLAAPHANVSQVAHRLSFPYTETITDMISSDTAMDISVNAGTALRLQSSGIASAPALLVEGTSSGLSFAEHTSRFDDSNAYLGLVSVADGFSLVGFNNSPFGIAAVLAEVSSFGVPTASAVQANNNAAGTYAYLARDNHAGLFDGDLHVDNGQVTKDYNSSPSPMSPAAYGFVNSTGTIGSGTANMSSTWNAALSRYEITLSDQVPSFNTHTTVVTVVDTDEARVATTNVISGKIVVKIWDITSGSIAVQDNFQIVIFNPNPNAVVNRSPVPAGMDPEYYYQKTGTTPTPVQYANPVEMPEPKSALSK